MKLETDNETKFFNNFFTDPKVKHNHYWIGKWSSDFIKLFRAQNFEKIRLVRYLKHFVAEVERSLPKLCYYSPVILECLGYCCNIFDKVLFFDESVKVVCDPQLLFPYPKTRGLFRALLNICDGVHFRKKGFRLLFSQKSSIVNFRQGPKYVTEYFPANIYLFKVNNRNTRKLTSLMSFCCFYCYLWTYFTPFSSVSIVNFKQVNVSWV